MSMQDTIEHKLAQGIAGLRHLEVLNESGRHNVPPGSASHFRVLVVADEFDGAGLLARHRRINDILAAELASGVHALAIHAYTPQEWRAKGGEAPASPPCLGGGRAS